MVGIYSYYRQCYDLFQERNDSNFLKNKQNSIIFLLHKKQKTSYKIIPLIE